MAVAEQEDWYLLPPGAEADFAVTWWRPLSEWAATWKQGTKGRTSAKPPPTTTVRLTTRGAVAGGAADECLVRFGAYVVVPHPAKDGWVIANNGPSGTAAPGQAPHREIAEIGLIRRTYPRKK